MERTSTPTTPSRAHTRTLGAATTKRPHHHVGYYTPKLHKGGKGNGKEKQNKGKDHTKEDSLSSIRDRHPRRQRHLIRVQTRKRRGEERRGKEGGREHRADAHGRAIQDQQENRRKGGRRHME